MSIQPLTTKPTLVYRGTGYWDLIGFDYGIPISFAFIIGQFDENGTPSFKASNSSVRGREAVFATFEEARAWCFNERREVLAAMRGGNDASVGQ